MRVWDFPTCRNTNKSYSIVPSKFSMMLFSMIYDRLLSSTNCLWKDENTTTHMCNLISIWHLHSKVTVPLTITIKFTFGLALTFSFFCLHSNLVNKLRCREALPLHYPPFRELAAIDAWMKTQQTTHTWHHNMNCRWVSYLVDSFTALFLVAHTFMEQYPTHEQTGQYTNEPQISTAESDRSRNSWFGQV